MPSTMITSHSPEPPPGALLLDVDWTAGRVALTGELDRQTCGHLSAACQMLAAAGPPTWVLDLTALEFCDASGLRALVAVRRAAMRTGGALVVVGARPYLRRLLELAGLGGVLAPIARAVPEPAVGRAARTAGVVPPATATGVSVNGTERCAATVARQRWGGRGDDAERA